MPRHSVWVAWHQCLRQKSLTRTNCCCCCQPLPASAATTALAACIVKRKRKRAKRFRMHPLFQRRQERGAYNTLMAELYDIMDLEGDATYHQIESRRIWFSVVVGERGYYRAAGISTTSTRWHETCRHSSEVIPVMQVSPHPRGVSENQVKKLIAVPKLCAPKTTLGLSTSIRIHFTTNPGQCRLPLVNIGIFRKIHVPKRTFILPKFN